MSTWAVIVAAGRGERAGLGMNKAFWPIDGRSMLARCLDAFEASGRFDGAVVVLSGSDEPAFSELTDREGPFALVRGIARGGATRRDSVYAGLLVLPEDSDTDIGNALLKADTFFKNHLFIWMALLCFTAFMHSGSGGENTFHSTVTHFFFG